MRPGKKFSAAPNISARPVSTLELSFPRLIFVMRYQKLSSRLINARVTQESYKRTVQAFHLFQDSAVHPLLSNNKNNITSSDPRGGDASPPPAK